jgi:hypothetical protein
MSESTKSWTAPGLLDRLQRGKYLNAIDQIDGFGVLSFDPSLLSKPRCLDYRVRPYACFSLKVLDKY